MPVSTSSQSLLASLPSFMSVFGNGPDRLEAYESDTAATTSQTETSKRPLNLTQPAPPTFRRDSSSTFESTESSPTTTISTVGSSLTEPSPRSPPETPDSSSPLSSFRYLRTNSVPNNQAGMEGKDALSSSFPTLPGVERADSPNKKMRNMKNLSVNTSASNRTGVQLPKLGLSDPPQISTNASSAPPTPAFIVPPKVARKKPSTLPLTITTPDSVTSSLDRPSAAPSQSPSDPQIRTLRFLQASSNGALFSPTVAPEGGMRLPPFAAPATSNRPSTTGGRIGKARPPLSVSPLHSFENSVSSPITRQTLDHVQEETGYEPPLSQEVKSPAYPQGPVCIYDPHVYLYLEPSHVEALEFDVILNVAREVVNPFLATVNEGAQTEKGGEIHQASNAEKAYLAGRDSFSEPQTAVSQKSFASALEAQKEDASVTAPGTPKESRPEPEYIHVPWDHNTNVVDDLLRLCELIDNRVRLDKKVLVHCQCGVSRSASLVVAYGLYKNPQLTVQEAYDAVKFRSRWIGPNMNLIYQLSEFKTKLVKTHPVGTAAWHSWRALGSGRSNPNAIVNSNPDSGLQSSGLRSPPQKSLSAPSQTGRDTRSSSFSPPTSAQLAPTSSGDVTPGPSSAPPDMQWSPRQRSPAPGAEAGRSYAAPAPTSASPANISGPDTEIVLSPSRMEREGIEERDAPAPVGGVAHDLHEVAKDLADNEHNHASISPPRMSFNPTITMSTSSLSQESSGEKETENVATMRQDCQHERKMSDKGWDKRDNLDPSSLPGSVTEDLGIQVPVVPRIKETEMTLSPTLPKTTLSATSPIFPAGFSSLLGRRQGLLGPHQLRLREGQTPPQLTTVQRSPRAIDPDVPQTPSLLSPRAAEFTASPFHRTSAGDLAGSSVFEQALMSPGAKEEDPRSPHQIGEAPITRSIFDMI